MSSIRSVLIFLTLLLVSIQGFSQDQEQNPELAREYFQNFVDIMEATQAYDQARDVLVIAANTDTTFVKANFEAGRIHILTINRPQAVQYFRRVLRQDPEYNFGIEYWIGKAYQFGLDFDKALTYYRKYKEKLSKKANYQGKDKIDNATVDRAILECENGKQFVANPRAYSIKNVGREINSEYHDYAPVMSEREDEIIFTSRRRDENLNQDVDIDNQPFEDIYFAKKSGNTWQFAKNIGAGVNTLTHESSLAISADGNTLFVYNDINGGDILYCDRKPDGTWGPLVPLPGIINSSFQEKSISVSKDESTLYFTSNRPGGLGETDIYRATKNTKGEWSNVKNLGPKINTIYEDDGPFIDYDGVTLFFSSKGHNGMGGHDIYRTMVDAKGEWSDPVNMGYPINTPDDDVFFISAPGSKKAYYSSIRDDGQGYTDIYLIDAAEGLKTDAPATTKTPEPVKEPVVVKKDPVVSKVDTTAVATIKTPVQDPPKQDPPKQDPPKKDPPKQDPPKKDPPKQEAKKELKALIYSITVVDADGKNPLDAKIKLQGKKDNVVVGLTPIGGGVYEFKITNASAKEYKLSVEVPGYVFVNQNLKLNGASEAEKRQSQTVEMRKLAVAVKGILRNIYFDYDKATFKTDSYAELNQLEAMLRDNQNITVEISGHTDGFGNWNYNKFLSQKRAEAVKDYLTKKGIDTRRIKAVGYGETKPLASNDDEDGGRELNRRVEFKVLKN